MDNENETSYKKITKTVVQAINDKNKKNKANIASLTNGGEIDEEYWAEKIRQFILDEVKTSKEYTQDQIEYVETSLMKTREAGHSNTANSKGGEEEDSAAASDGGEGEAKDAGHSNAANSKGGEEDSAAASDGGEGEAKDAGHSNAANSKGGEEDSAAASDGGEGEAKEAGHSNTANSKGGEEEHDYSVSANVVNLLKSLKGVKEEQLCHRQVRRASQRYMKTYS